MKTINLVPIIKKYTSGWIALSRDYRNIIAHENDYETLEKALKKKGIKDAILMPAAKNYRGFIT